VMKTPGTRHASSPTHRLNLSSKQFPAVPSMLSWYVQFLDRIMSDLRFWHRWLERNTKDSCLLIASYVAYITTLKMEALYLSETTFGLCRSSVRGIIIFLQRINSICPRRKVSR
jgi:hypothetical protein